MQLKEQSRKFKKTNSVLYKPFINNLLRSAWQRITCHYLLFNLLKRSFFLNVRISLPLKARGEKQYPAKLSNFLANDTNHHIFQSHSSLFLDRSLHYVNKARLNYYSQVKFNIHYLVPNWSKSKVPKSRETLPYLAS